MSNHPFHACGEVTTDNSIADTAREDSGDDKPQVPKFIDTARALGCDEDEARFDAALRKVATAKPVKEPKAPKPEGGDGK